MNVTMCEFSVRHKQCDGITRSEYWGEGVGYCGHSSERTAEYAEHRAGVSLSLDRCTDRPEAHPLFV